MAGISATSTFSWSVRFTHTTSSIFSARYVIFLATAFACAFTRASKITGRFEYRYKNMLDTRPHLLAPNRMWSPCSGEKCCWDGSQQTDPLGVFIDTRSLVFGITRERINKMRGIEQHLVQEAHRNRHLFYEYLLRYFAGGEI